MRRLLSGVCGAAFALVGVAASISDANAQGVAGGASPDTAQTATPADAGVSAVTAAPPTTTRAGDTLGEVVVTARKREENLQNVPVAVTVLSGADLAKQSAVNFTEIGLTVPSFKIGVSPGEGSALLVQIRGQVASDIISTLDPSVGVYVDGIYWSRPVGADAALTDISSLQVLKGPQGTLFGRNTTGGAVVINTNDPNLSKFSGLATLTGGAYNELDSGLIVNIPIIEDKLAIRGVWYHNSHDGYDYDRTTSQRVFSQDNTTLRLKVLAQPTPKSRIMVSYENFDVDETTAALQPTYVQPGGFAALYGNIFSGVGATGSPDTLNQYVGVKPHTAFNNNDLRETVHTQTLGTTGSYDLGFGTLKLIGGYRKENTLSDDDVDGTPFTILGEQSKTLIEEFTGEAQLTGRVLDGRLDYAVGYYWFKESGHDDSTISPFVGLNPNNPQYILGDIRNRSQAGYFQASYKLTDALSVTGGVRYSTDHKVLISHNAVQTPGGYSCQLPNAQGAITTPSACSQEFGVSSSDPDYTGGLDYKLTRSVLAYIRIAHGYRAGGNQLRGGIAAESFAPFQPETALNYEAGLKSEFFDHRFRVNVAGYYTDYSNIQRAILVPTATGSVATVIANAASGKIYGGEFEGQAIVLPGLRLGTTLSVTEASYDQYQDVLGDHADEPFPYTPEISYSLTGDYSRPAPHGNVDFHVDWSWQSTVHFPVGYTDGGSTAANFPLSAASSSPYGLLGLRASYQFDSPNIQVAVFGRNVTDKKYRTSGVDLVDAAIGLITAQYGAPATYGVQVTYKFGG